MQATLRGQGRNLRSLHQMKRQTYDPKSENTFHALPQNFILEMLWKPPVLLFRKPN